MDIVRYLRVLKRRWRVIAALAVVGAIAGFVLSPRGSSSSSDAGPRQYAATHTLWTTSGPGSGASGSTNTNARPGGMSLDQIALAVTTGDVPQQVARSIGGDPATLASRVIARANNNLGTIDITAQGDDPEDTTRLANTFAEETLTWVANRQQEDVNKSRTNIQQQIDQLKLEVVSLAPGDPAIAQKEARIRSLDEQLTALDGVAVQTPQLGTWQAAVAYEVTPEQIKTLFNKNAPQKSGGNKNQQAGPTARDVQASNASTSKGFKLNPLLGALLGLGLGAGLGMLLVLVMNSIDPRLNTKEEAEATLGFPVIAEIPAFSRKLRKETIVISREAPYSRFAEAYRVLRSSILFVQRHPNGPATTRGNGNGAAADADVPTGRTHKDGTAQVVMVTSPGPSEGKTTTVANLATVLAEDGSQVLVVNCDFRRPQLHTYLGGADEPCKVFDTKSPGVKLVTGVVQHPERVAPAEVIGAQRRLILNALDHFDYVLLDTAPILTTNDASELLPVVDMVIMICRSGKTTRESADRAAEVLERFDAPVIGAALVATTDSPSQQYYYYYSQRTPSPDDIAGNPLDDLAPSNGNGNGNGDRGERTRGNEADDNAPSDTVLPDLMADVALPGSSARPRDETSSGDEPLPED